MNDPHIYETFSIPAQSASWLATSKGFASSYLCFYLTQNHFVCDGHDLKHLTGKRSFSVRISLLDHPFSTHGVKATFLNEPGAMPARRISWYFMVELEEHHLGLVYESFLYHTSFVKATELQFSTACTSACAHWFGNHL
jgi:hypothetical protein